MKWVTRERPKTDRIACPWLIRRFVDPDAEFIFVPGSKVLSVAAFEEAISFDAPGATFAHAGDRCTFEVLIAHYGLEADAALVRLANVVHSADIDADVDSDPAGFGLRAIGVGGLDVERDDHRLLERAAFVYDALYAWCQRETR
ncbi:MAG: hypothetical protein FD127_414 [Acidimicrobiaceae bacterium]|nr:MAG: hypothetical protein FD127_414 [Acidimicrobiaceae bacterium]